MIVSTIFNPSQLQTLQIHLLSHHNFLGDLYCICSGISYSLVLYLFLYLILHFFYFVLDVKSSSVCTGKCSFFRCVSISYCDQWPLWVISWSKLEIVIFPCLTFDKKAKNQFHALSSTFTQCWLNFSFISHWRVAVGQIRLNQMYLETGSTLIGREHTFLSQTSSIHILLRTESKKKGNVL